MTVSDKDLLVKTGKVDMDKIAKAFDDRNNDTDNMLSDLQDWIDDPDKKFTAWDIDFVNSLTDWRERKRDITIPQYETLLKLYTKHL